MTSTFHTHKEQYVSCVSLRGIFASQRLLHFKTVHNALVRSGSHHNCPFKSQLFTVAYTIHHLPMGGFVAISALTEVVRLVLDRFKSLSDKVFHFQQQSRAVLPRRKHCSRTTVSSVNRSPIR